MEAPGDEIMTDNLGDCQLIGEPASEEERDLTCMGPSQAARAGVARWVMRQIQDGAHLVQGGPGEQTAVMLTIMDWIYDRNGKDTPDELTAEQTQAKVEQAIGAFKSALGSLFGPRPGSAMTPDEAAAVFTGKEAFCTGKDEKVTQATRDTPETLAEGGHDDIPEGAEPGPSGPVFFIDSESRMTGQEEVEMSRQKIPVSMPVVGEDRIPRRPGAARWGQATEHDRPETD